MNFKPLKGTTKTYGTLYGSPPSPGPAVSRNEGNVCFGLEGVTEIKPIGDAMKENSVRLKSSFSTTPDYALKSLRVGVTVFPDENKRILFSGKLEKTCLVKII